MKSIRSIYKIGKGPSSSHTMGPERAAKLFKERYPKADRFEVILYGSLSKTGVGHGTDRVIREVLSPVPTEIIFSAETLSHPNTLDLRAFENETELGFLRVESIGGGDIRYAGQETHAEEEMYVEHSFAEIADFCKWRYIDTLSEYVELNEGPEIWDFLMEVWLVMKNAISEGLAASGTLPGGLNVQKKAKYLYEQKPHEDVAALKEFQTIAAYAYAVAEQNADNGTVVTAPTCGAECGCQAEIGTACSMAAAALAELFGQSIDQVEYAAEVAMEHHLGLTCDPICGLVQIPCIERNAVAAVRAMNACNLSYFLTGSRRISYDMVCRAMKETGVNLNHRFRETSEGGLAKLYTRKK